MNIFIYLRLLFHNIDTMIYLLCQTEFYFYNSRIWISERWICNWTNRRLIDYNVSDQQTSATLYIHET